MDSLGILHITSHFSNCVQFCWAHCSQSLPNTAVILISAKQSTSAPWDLFGGQPKKCLCRFINENEVGMVQSKKSNLFLHFDLSALFPSFNFFGLCLGYNRDMLLVGVVSFFCFEISDQLFTISMLIPVLSFVHVPSLMSVSNSPAFANSVTALV